MATVPPLPTTRIPLPFSPEEYDARVEKVRQSMAEQKFDLLLITEPENIFYLTGYQTVGAPQVQALMLPAKNSNGSKTSDELYFVTRLLEITNATYRSNLRKMEVYADFESGIDKVIDVILKESPHAKRIGVEMKSRRLDCAQMETLKKRLSDRTLSDCSTLIPKHRLVKSKAEIEVIRRAAEICAAGVKAGQSARVGMTETQIGGKVYEAMAEKGLEYPAYPPFICAGESGCLGHYTGSSTKTLRDGEVLFLEIGGCFERYHAAMMRTCYVGTSLPPELAKAEEAVGKAMQETMRLMKPGAVAKDVDAAARKILGNLEGMAMSLRSGYSIGIGFYTDWGEAEHFKMDPGSDQVYEEGMVMHLIPWLQLPGFGGVGLSDTVVVTKDGAVSLVPEKCVVPRKIALIPPPAESPYAPVEAQRVRRVLALEPTPLPKLSADCIKGLGSVHIKDESKRLGLQAFKVVGGAYSMLRFMCKRLALPLADKPEDALEVQRLYQQRFGTTVFVTATDGNHGRGVAWAAKRFGQKAVVYMPKGSAQQRLQHLLDLGAEAEITSLNYDDTVEMAFKQGREKGWVVLQDTTGPGYTEIPEWIMQGYTAMVDESVEVMPQLPTHVVLQMGVGSLAAAVVGYFLACKGYPEGKRPTFMVIEPKNAACGFASAKAGKLTEVLGDLETMIAGLACGIPSSIAWPILCENVAAFISLEDGLAGNGMRLLKREGVEAGECGGAAAGMLQHVMHATTGRAAELREAMGLGPDSHVLLINTEGATDPENYKKQLELPDVKPPGNGELLDFVLGKAASESAQQAAKRRKLA
eukprot:TRINITY_DN3961_c0_g1_i1.p1 TRINITY_DN3961_c0_g1~~TRINITY_DN3961_c0_g1_i1.p1  ORF type:complete len:836 (-),score=212.37 TRINITY_DN3961_c0_g1_i1:296-2728(-)